MDTSNKSGRKDSATGQLRTRADFKFQISLIMPPTVLPFRGTRLKFHTKRLSSGSFSWLVGTVAPKRRRLVLSPFHP